MPNPSNRNNDNPSDNQINETSTHATNSSNKLGATEPTSHNSADVEPAYVTVAHTPKRSKLEPNKGRAVLWYALALVMVALDQWTKWLAETKLTLHEPIPVIDPFLNWTLAYNPGAAFSLLANQPGWQKWFFAILASVMALFLTICLIRTPRQAKWLNMGLALLLGGAIGNLIDRLRIGKVVDFIHVHYADVWHYPIFNVADMAICVGVAIALIDMIFLESKRNAKHTNK